MRISKNDYDTMLKQIYLDCNVGEAVKVKDDLYIAPSVVLPGSRVINKMDPFFRVIVFMETFLPVPMEMEIFPVVIAASGFAAGFTATQKGLTR